MNWNHQFIKYLESSFPSTAASAESTKFFGKFFGADDDCPNSEIREFQRLNELKLEVKKFTQLISDDKFVKKVNSTASFWIDFKSKLPILYKLRLILSNISSSSAFIERYFSLCGMIFDKRRHNMNDDLFEMRSLLKTNMSLLNDSNEQF